MSQFGSNRIDFLIASRLLRQDIVSPELTLENFYTDSGRYVGHFLILFHVTSRVNNKSSPHVNESCLNVVAIDLK